MPKNRYDPLTYLLLLSFVAGIIQCIASFITGNQIYALEIFRTWLLVTGILSIVQSILLLAYYRSQQYWFPFYAGIAFTFSVFSYCIIVYLVLQSGTLTRYVLPLFHVMNVVGVIYGASLIFSKSGRQFWLRMAGIFTFGIAISTFLWHASGMVAQCISLAGSLVPVYFILHFRNKASDIKVYSLVVLGIWIVTLPIGLVLLRDASLSVYWAKQNFIRAKEMAQLFEARIFVDSKGDTLRYRLLKPLQYDNSHQYPMVVSLPYGGQSGTDTIRQIEGAGAAQLLSSDSNRHKYPAFLLVPNCPSEGGWGGIPGHPSADTLVYQVIESLFKQYTIDTRRVYVTGISRGGYGTWNFICTRPDLFAAAIPICGGGNPVVAARAKEVAIWAFHGEKDKNAPVKGSRDMIAAIRRAGGKPRYKEFANEGHNIGYKVETTPGLWDWLFAQRKNK